MIAVPSAEFKAHDRAMSAELALAEVHPLPFSDVHVDSFIRDFAKCEGDAGMWLEDQGIKRECFASAELLRNLAGAWITNPAGVYAVAGVAFWREMKELAAERHKAD